MNKDSNKATFLFSSIMVVVVAVMLSVTSISLAPYQSKNSRIEKMKNILSSVSIITETADTERQFEKSISQQIVLNNKGEEATGKITAFDIDLKKELDYLKGFLVSVDKKLSNERFVQNAKPEVVDVEKKKKQDAEQKIKAIEESLASLN